MAEKLRLGIIGMSEGNGHPYSWSAIFNGYKPDIMAECPFPAIPNYLSEQKFPEAGLGEFGEVTHIWTQDQNTSKHIAAAAKIVNVVSTAEEMLGNIDALLLARDDAQNHYKMALPFLRAGIPVFIDKPLALSVEEAEKILKAQIYFNQIFCCSSLRYAQEICIGKEDRETTGEILHVDASVPKYWDTYSVHVIEPIIANLPERGALRAVTKFEKNKIRMAYVEWENVSAHIKVTGIVPTPITFTYFGKKGNVTKIFTDSFSCFKESLANFIEVIQEKKKTISREETLEIVEIIEEGRK